MTIEIHTSLAAVATFRQEWIDLVQETAYSTPFSHPNFALTVWDKLLKQPPLRIVTGRVDGRLVGVWALYQTSSSKLKSLTHEDVSDYAPFIVQSEYETAFISQSIALLRASGYREITLYGIPAQTSWLGSMAAKICKINTKFVEVCPIITLPNMPEFYLENLKRKQRHELRRKFRKLQEIPASFSYLSSGKEAFEVFHTLHMASSPEKKAFWTPQTTECMQQLFDSSNCPGELRLYFAKVNTTYVACAVILVDNSSFYLYNSGFIPDFHPTSGLGILLVWHTINEAIREGKTTYDFLRGDEAYKYRFGGVSQDLLEVQLQF